MFARACVYEKGLERQSRVGDGFVANPLVNVYATDAILTISIPQLLGGILQVTGLTAGRNFTTPTAADIIAAMPDMDIGDTYMFLVSVTTAFAITWVAGSGVTLAGRSTTPASTATWIAVTKTSSTAVTWNVI